MCKNIFFRDKVILITGSTSGIGQGIAKALLEQGAKVIINYAHSEKNAESTREFFKEYEDNTLFVKADVSNENEVKNMFLAIKEKFNRLDCLVNNAGINVDSYIENFDIEDFRNVLNVNLLGKVICTKYAIPLLKESENASIVNIASRLGTKPCEEASAYCSAEAGIINFTRSKCA